MAEPELITSGPELITDDLNCKQTPKTVIPAGTVIPAEMLERTIDNIFKYGFFGSALKHQQQLREKERQDG